MFNVKHVYCPYLMPLNGETGGEENTGSQSHMTNTLCYGVKLSGVKVGNMEG